MLTEGFLWNSLSVGEVSIPISLKGFNLRGCWILLIFIHLLRQCFYSVNVINYIDGFLNVRQFLYSRVSTPLGQDVLFFIYYQIQHAKILLQIFVYYVQGWWSVVFLLLMSLFR